VTISARRYEDVVRREVQMIASRLPGSEDETSR
jgi:hypothetical protein